MAPEEEVIRGGDAAQVLDAPIFVEAKKAIEEGIRRQMAAVPMSDQTMHTRLILALQMWDTLAKYLENVRQTGEIAQFQINQQDEQKKRFALFSR